MASSQKTPQDPLRQSPASEDPDAAVKQRVQSEVARNIQKEKPPETPYFVRAAA